jgi:endo-beta-N-acetylglucosaminidase D
MQFITRRQFSYLVAGLCLDAHGMHLASMQSQADAQDIQAPRYPLTGETKDGFAALMAYDPANDPDAPFFRSNVRQAQRIPAFAATQAHPSLSALPRLASLTGCYRSLGPRPDDRHRRQRYGNAPNDGVYVSRMIGPLDVIVGWSGTGIVPNPAITDVAHRNGALCLGLIFQPDKRVFDSSIFPARKVAAQYTRLASYFGYDGYFVNFESGTAAEHEQVLAFITMMREEARDIGEANFYVQFYDGSSDMDQLLPKLDDAAGHAHSEADSVMLDQGWSGYSMVRGCCSGRPRTPEQIRQYCEKNGLNPFLSAYFGFQLYPGPGYFGVAAPSVISPNGASSAFGSLQLYSYEDGFWTMRKALTANTAKPLPPSQAEDAFYDLERRFFSGQSGNPALNNKPSAEQARLYAEVAEGTRRYADYTPTADPATEQVTLPITYGVSNFTVERSVIGTFPFLTRFNTGAGQHFFLEGKQVSSRPWFNLGIQDLLPTWQWRMEPINGGFDREARNFAPLQVRYDAEVAFHGGSSLHIDGRLRAEEQIALYLYKTRLPIQGKDPYLHLVWRGNTDTVQHLALGLLFEDAPSHAVWLPLRDTSCCIITAAGAGWWRSRFKLGHYRSRTLAALVLGFFPQPGVAAETVFDLHLGEIYAGEKQGAVQLGAPTSFTATGSASQSVPGTLDIRFSWQAKEHDAWFDIFSVSPIFPQRCWLGRINGDHFYAEAVPYTPGTSLTFELVATSTQALLTSGPAARAKLSPAPKA